MVITRSLTNRASADTATDIKLGSCVTEIGHGAFSGYTNLTEIKFPESLTRIGVEAFSGSSVITVDIPYSVTSIGNSAFEWCQNLSSCTIGSGVTSIGNSAFKGCSSLSSVTIPYSVTSIGNSAFEWCQNLSSCTIGSGVTSIGNSAFKGCSSLSSVTIPDSVTSIDDDAFNYCSGLTSVTIPNSVTSIGNRAFYDCSGLTSVTISSGVTDIGYEAFNNCRGLIRINVNALTPPVLTENSGNYVAFDNTNECSIYVSQSSYDDYMSAETWSRYYSRIIYEGIPYKALFETTSGIKRYIKCDSGTSVSALASMPSYITSTRFGNCIDEIADKGFNNKSLGNVVIPSNVKRIGNSAFTYAYTESITFSEGLETIGDKAFYYFNNSYYDFPEIYITLPSTLNTVGAQAFALSKISGITINGSSTLEINGKQFNSKVLKEMTIRNIKSVKFNDYSALTSVSISNVDTIQDDGFRRCSALTNLSITSNKAMTIGNGAFEYCSSLSSVTIPDSVTSIGNRAFKGCRSLSSVTIPNSVISIGDSAFYYCSSLSSVTIPDSVTSIGNGAFEDCSSLSSVTIPNSVTSIGNSAFGYCSSLTSVTIPNSVISIGDSAFYYCSSLSSVTIPNSVTSIGNSAFEGCRSLSSVTIPNSVISIGDSAFYYCSSLSSVTIERATPPVINANVFDYTACPIYVPRGSYDLYVNAENWTTYADRIVESGNINKAYVYVYDNGYSIQCGESSELSKNDFVSGKTDNVISLIIGRCTTNIENDLCSGNSSLSALTIPDTVVSIGDNAFSGVSLVSVTIPNSVTSIGKNAFFGGYSNTRNLSGLTLNCHSAQIGNGAFEKTCIESVTVPSGNTYGSYVFAASKLKNAIIEEGNTTIPYGMFYDCSGLASVTIPDSVTSIGNSAFKNCIRLSSVTIPNSVTSIGNSAFGYCSSLTSVTIPNSVTSIDDDAFKGAPVVIRMKGTVPPTLGLRALESARVIYVPCSAYDAYVQAWSMKASEIVAYGNYAKQEVIENEYFCEKGNKYEKVERYVSEDGIDWCLVGYIKGNLIEESSEDCK